MTTEDGKFLGFEPLTFVPVDLESIQVELMEEKDIQLLNDYHRSVYEKVSPYLNDEEIEWLKQATRAVYKGVK